MTLVLQLIWKSSIVNNQLFFLSQSLIIGLIPTIFQVIAKIYLVDFAIITAIKPFFFPILYIVTHIYSLCPSIARFLIIAFPAKIPND